jgi:hypothetical protein
MKSGMNSYLDSRSLPQNTTYVTKLNIFSSVWDKMKGCINDNKPCIIGLASHSTYDDHWVVGTGYRIYESTNNSSELMIDTFYYRINDGWRNTTVYVNSDYVDGVIYIE